MVLDFRKLHGKTIGDSYHLPNANDILDYLGSAKYFLVFDLATGFHHIKMNPKHNLAERLRKANLHLQPDKCGFLRPEVGYLGHIIDRYGRQ